MYEHLITKTQTNMAKIAHIIGKEYQDYSGQAWVLHSCNDLGVPYFHKKGRKTLYVVTQFRDINELI